MLRPEFTAKFERDVKRLKKKHRDVELRRRHRMHELKGTWQGAKECHVANVGDWLCVWQVADGLAIFLRTGTHDEIFG